MNHDAAGQPMEQDKRPAEAGGLSPVKRALIEIRRLRARVAQLEQGAARGGTAAPGAGGRQPIAIVGLGCRAPGGISDPDSLWRLLAEGRDAIGEVPVDWQAAHRWNIDALYDPDPEAPGKISTRWCGFMDAVDRFDADFFNISPREAEAMDPQQRLLLEVAWETIENAAWSPRDLFGSPTGVFVGIGAFDYLQLELQHIDPEQIDPYFLLGGVHSVASGRLAYHLGLRGPAISLDTACSSTLVATHLACQSLRAGECRAALAGGVSLLLSPELMINFSRTRVMAGDGRCKTFDAAADGYVRAEGCALVALKRLADARADGDRILAVIRGTAINQDGRSSGLTAPNGPSQTAVIRAALDDAGIAPAEVDYLEAHGTGTELGDPIEARAAGEAYRPGRPADRPLWIGSVKTNIGHLENAAGTAGLIKVVLALQHGQIPASLHMQTPSPHIDWATLPLRVPTRLTPWPRPDGRPRRGAVSAFGFSGTNAHMIVEEAPAEDAPTPDAQTETAPPRPHLLVLSARTRPALAQLARRWAAWLECHPETRLADAAWTAGAGRAHFQHRLALVATTPAGAAAILTQFAAQPDKWAGGEAPDGLALTVGEARGESPTGGDGIGCGVAAKEPAAALLTDLGRRYVNGAEINWEGLIPPPRRKLAAPTMPFQRERYWSPMIEAGRTPESKVQTPPAPTAGQLWDATLGAARRQAAQAPLDMDLAAYPAKWRALERLTVAWILHTLKSWGVWQRAGEAWTVADLRRRLNIQPVYDGLARRWCERLAAAGWLERVKGDRFRAPAPLPPADLDQARTEARVALADMPFLIDYIERCGTALAAVLTGRDSALETLFPGGSTETAEGLYQNWAPARYFNAIVAETVAARVGALLAAAPAGRAIRLLEIGAGTGGTTAAVLPRLPAGRAHYDYTDVSEVFFNQAERKFAAWPFVRYRVFDAERDPAGQGFAPGSYDVVIAANVLHATRDLGEAIGHAAALLAPGGLLVLYETTDHPAWFDISIGLIEGWHRFADRWRKDNPLLGPDGWIEALTGCGLACAAALPEPSSPATVLPNHILVAQAPGAPADSGHAPAAADKPKAAETAAPEITAAASATASAAPVAAGQDSTTPAVGDLNGRLAAATAQERLDLLVDLVRGQLAAILRRGAARPIDRRDRLMDLGLDSLMAVELRNRLGKNLGLAKSLPATLIFDYPTVEAVAGFLEKRLGAGGAPAGKAAAAIDASPLDAKPAATMPSAAAAELDGLTPDELERRLVEKLTTLND